MRWLLFLSRLALISGIFILLAISLRMKDWLKEETMVSTIGVMYYLGLLLVPITNLCYLVVLLLGKKMPIVPRWLIIANFIFLIALLFYIFYLDDPYYHQT